MRIAFVDTYYPEVLRSPNLSTSSYKERLSDLLKLKFGTSNFYSNSFKLQGWEAIDIIANDNKLNELYMKEKGFAYCDSKDTVKRILYDYQPEIIYCQDLSFFNKCDYDFLRSTGVKLIVGQCSCPWPSDERVALLDIVFTSFPHYIPRIQSLGVKSHFLQIGFGLKTSILAENHIDVFVEGSWIPLSDFASFLRHPRASYAYPVSFVGGIGRHWDQGNRLLSEIAKQIPDFRWWGYGVEYTDSPLTDKYQGQAWGMDMYRVYANSKIVINRHGEVAEGYSNNMRMFEATGCGALLMTEDSKNIKDYFEPGKECVTYTSTEDLIQKINYYLQHEDERRVITSNGQARTMRDHCYEEILIPVSNLLKEKIK